MISMDMSSIMPLSVQPAATSGRLQRFWKRGLLVLLTVLACLITGAGLVATVHSKPVPTGSPLSAPASAVVALGSIVPGDAVLHLNAPSSSGEAQLSQLFVRENQLVAKDQIFGTLDSRDRLEAAVSVARAQVSAKQAALIKTQAGNSAFEVSAQQAAVDRLHVEADREADEYRRYNALHEAQLISETDWESHRVSFHSASAAMREAQANLAKAAEVRPVDVALALADLDSELANLRSAQAALKQAFLRAPVAGRVLHIYTWPGERVGDAGVLDLAATNEVYAEAEVYETDLNRIHFGQTATVTSPALSQPLSGTVSNIGQSIGRQQVVNIDPAANTDARVAVVRVRLDPAQRDIAERVINLQVRVDFRP